MDRERDLLTACESVIDYTFVNRDFLRAALTHTSGANTRLASNERMELLGDAVLGLVIVEYLYNRFPEYQEGDLTKIKSAVVSRRTCARISTNLNLGQYLVMGKGMSRSENVLADVFESLVAAVYLDGGLPPAQRLILEHMAPEIELLADNAASGNYKSQLQQTAQKQFNDTPRYLLLDEQGPDHNKCFKIGVEIARKRYPAAWGLNKKEAELKAAMNALAVLDQTEVPYPGD